MNDAEVISGLLQFYKSQGMDLHYMLDDPIFHKLPIQSKVEAIKRHALDIAHGTSPGFGRLERKALITRAITTAVKGAIAGGVAGASIGAVARGAPGHAPLMLGAIAGASAGLFTSAVDTQQSVSGKNAVRNQLLATAANPTDSNALGSLSIRGIHAVNSKHQDYLRSAMMDSAENTISHGRMAGLLEGYVQRLEAAKQPQVI